MSKIRGHISINTDLTQVVGDKNYELSNLPTTFGIGNVLQVVIDRKLAIDSGDYNPETGTYYTMILGGDGVVDYFTSDVVSQSDYYPFGMMLPGRNSSEDEYRYRFQGQEMDDEIKGEGNSVNYTYRTHDPRVGRFFSVDPISNRYLHSSPYAFSENRVIDGIELEGLEVFVINDTLGPLPLHGEDKSDIYSPQITSVDSSDNETIISEIYGNTDVIKHIWPGFNNTQARYSEADCFFETIIANRIEGEAITIVGHSHGGNVAILTAQRVYEYYKEQGIEVEINLITLNTPCVVDGGYELSSEASEEINWIEVFTFEDKVVPMGGNNETGILNEGGETKNVFGMPDGEYSYKEDVGSDKSGSANFQHPQADVAIEYKDQYSFFKRHGNTGGTKTCLVAHRGWLHENTKKWIPTLEKVAR